MNPIAILMYHSLDTSGSVVSVTPQNFAEQMACVRDEGYQGISLKQALAHHAQHGEWQERAVVLTFDDGFTNVHKEALPILAKNNFTATVFVVSQFIGKQNDWEKPPQGLGKQEIISWSQAKELLGAGIEIGSHTRTHPDLRLCSLTEAEREVSDSRVEIEDNLGTKVESFAYPFGSENRALQELASKTYRAACTTELKRVNGEDLCNLPRVDAYYLKSLQTLQRLLRGQLDNYLTIRRWGRTVRRLFV
jgi:peptidoglycan/xylan/chitin deacetylase (PgdA/CDA1 family)